MPEGQVTVSFNSLTKTDDFAAILGDTDYKTDFKPVPVLSPKCGIRSSVSMTPPEGNVMGKASNWFGPLSGILFVAAVAAGGSLFGELDAEPSNSASRVLAEFRESADDIERSALLTMLGIGFLLVFLGHLRTKFRDGGAGWAADGFLAGGVVLASAWIVLLGVQLAGGVAGEHGHAEVAQGALDFMWEGVFIFSPGLLAVGIAAAVVSFTNRTLPIWLGVFAVVVALGALAPWMGIFVLVAWVLATSIAELIGAFRPVAAVEVR